MEIKRPRIAPKVSLGPKDRESLDFARFLDRPSCGQPTPGISYSKLLEIATDVCGVRVTASMKEVTTKKQVKEIKERIKRSYYDA